MPAYAQQQSTTRTTGGTTGGSGAAVSGDIGNTAKADKLKGKAAPKDTGIVHFGLNGGADVEAALLNRLNGDKGGAKSIRNQKEQDVLVRNKQRMDLATTEGRAAWLATLGFGEDVAKGVDSVISNAGSGARDELAQLVEVYAQAQAGTRRMDRLVLSGHNVGSAMWGDDNGRVPFETFVELGAIFPDAAAQVRHLLVSACYSGGESQMDTYKEAFPGLLSIMAYTGSSPGTHSGAQNHISRWEKATEKGDGSNVDKDIAKNTRKGENVSTWNGTDGYQGDQPTPYYELDAELSRGDATFNAYYDEGRLVTDAQSGELRTYYNLVQRALRHPELPDGRKAELEGRRDITIRLLYYKVIRERFATKYADKLTAGYGKTAVPDFGKLERADALAAVVAFYPQATSAEGAVAFDLLQRGLVRLDKDVIPEQWL